MPEQQPTKYPRRWWALAGFQLSALFWLISFFGAMAELPKDIRPLARFLWKVSNADFMLTAVAVPTLAFLALILFLLDKDKWAWRLTIVGSALGPLFFLLLTACYAVTGHAK